MRLTITNLLLSLLLTLTGLALSDAAQQRGAETAHGAEGNLLMSQTNEFGLAQIGQIAVTVNDLERAVAFYRDKLRLRYLFTAGGMAFFDCAGIRLMLTRPEERNPQQLSSIIYFKVADIRQGYRTLSERGVQFAEQPELAARTEEFDLWLACFRDSESNLLCLMSEVPRR